MIQRYAYTIPEHRASRWMLLLFSDQVDELESQAIDTLKNPWFILSATLSVGAALYLSKPSSGPSSKLSSNFSEECSLLKQRA